MKYKYGDVVLYGVHHYVVVGVNDEYGTVDLLSEVASTNNVSVNEVKKIGHEDGFRENIQSILTRHEKQRNKAILENQKQMVSLLADGIFSNGCTEYYVTGKTKVDGPYLYCQVREDNFYDWVLLEDLLEQIFFK